MPRFPASGKVERKAGQGPLRCRTGFAALQDGSGASTRKNSLANRKVV
jgi:hypothetical protein